MAPKSVSVTIRYSKPGSQPPIFLAGSFSDPAWHPQEMQYTTSEAGENEFYKEVQVEEGSAYQYKFRIGEGEWMLNEDSPTVTDDAGNRNNLLSVPVSEEQTTEPKHDEHPPAAEEAISHPTANTENTISEHISGDATVDTPIDTKDEEHVKEETAEEGRSEPKEHATITPAQTNTPVPEIVEDAKEPDIPEVVKIPEEVQADVHHIHEDASISPAVEEDNARAEQTADSLLQPMDGSHSEEDESQTTSETLAQIPSGAVEPTSTPAEQVADSLLQPIDGAHSVEDQSQATSESRTADVALNSASTNGPPTSDLTQERSGFMLYRKAYQAQEAAQHPELEPPEISTPTVQPDQESPEIKPAPTLILEKVDDELRHGDDFGSAATIGQKDAHLLRSQDAVPDQVITRSDSRTPELAETAAEVAESAALLDRDRDPPTPPMSDEEAGRIGYRRMSSTPIPEVAKTAAEVADVAATLHDRPALHLETAPEASAVIDDEEDLPDSGASTPASQKAPRFSYECLGEEAIGVPALPTHSRSPTDPLEPIRSPYDEPVAIDWNDPSIERFPTDRAGIFHTIRRLTEHLPEDVPDLDIVPPSPVIGPNGQIQEGRSPAPSPAVIAHQLSPSLDSITEENDEILFSLPVVSKLTSRGSDKENTTLNKWLNNSMTASNEDEKANSDGASEPVEPETPKSAEVESKTDVTKPESEPAEPVVPVVQAVDEVETEEALNKDVVEETREREPELSSTSKDEELTTGETIAEETTAEETIAEETKPSHIELPQGSGVLELTSKEQREETITTPEEISTEVKEVAAESPPPEPVEQASHAPSPETPLVVSDRQLGHDDEVREITTDGDSPNITVQPATPAASKTEFVPKPLDTAKTTAIEEENGRQVTSRKPPRSQSPERPITPSSMRSATKDAKSKNFLKAFWRVVFVDWIGGIIRALCGGRGSYT
ncbi:hypothetical protein V8E51_016413 [Hyaloscypha variabilis]